MTLRPKSIQQRLAIFMLLPVALLLIAMGVLGYSYARRSLFNEWREAAPLKLQRAAHSVDMRLSNIKEWIYPANFKRHNRPTGRL